MGVPAFFRWLCMRCPQILHDVIDELPEEYANDPEYANRPEIEIDNLYLDMNGIIHPCTHPEHLPIPKPLTEDDMFNNIFKYLDMIIDIVKPKKLIYFAIDGVAPRAKMNQQRGRRFRAAQEAERIKIQKEKLKQEWQEKGMEYPEELDSDLAQKFDSNVITPGTEFMDRLSKALQYYITERMNKDQRFQNLKCIFSDAQVPGEGEHKMLEFLRQQRALDTYNPNTRHCIYGADADLIMLGLSTHEPHFYILRETIMTKAERDRMSGDSNLKTQEREGEFGERARREIPVKFQFVKLHVFREYLDYEFKYLKLPFPYNLECIIDDFVFMCFFVGNDFLPHMPCLGIREGGIDSLLYLYKRVLPFMKGYFIENGELNLMRVDVFLREIGQIEEALLRANTRREENRSRSNKRNREREERERRDERDRERRDDRGYRDDPRDRDNRSYDRSGSREDRFDSSAKRIIDEKRDKYESERINKKRDQANLLRDEIASLFKEGLKEESKEPISPQEEKKAPEPEEKPKESTGVSLDDWSRDVDDDDLNIPIKKKKPQAKSEAKEPEKPKIPEEEESKIIEEVVSRKEEDNILKALETLPDDEENVPDLKEEILAKLDPKTRFKLELDQKIKQETPDAMKDDIKLGEWGYKPRYYFDKFKITPQEFPEFRLMIQKAYTEALCWIFAYYYKGCVSWNWYYPFHYTPFASDIVGIDKVKVEFELGKPFKPIDQLLAVLPPYSAKAVPACMRHLMLNDDSEIIDFYPKDFIVDSKGKRFAWMGEVILPFIEEDRLLKAIAKYEGHLTSYEAKRNQLGENFIYVHENNILIEALKQRWPGGEYLKPGTRTFLDYEKAEIGGTFIGIEQRYELHKDYPRPHNVDAIEPIKDNRVVCLAYQCPSYKPHLSVLLKGLEMPRQVMSEQMWEQVDRKAFGGGRAVNIIERTLGVQSGYDNRPNRGAFNNVDYHDGIRTNYGYHAGQTTLGSFNPDFNNNRGYERGPTQFKRFNPNEIRNQTPPPLLNAPQFLQHQPGYQPVHIPVHPMYQGQNAYHQNVPPQAQAVNVRPYNPNDFQGGYNQFNPGFMQMPGGNRTNRFAGPPQNQGTNLQNTNNPFDVAFNVKRQRPQSQTPDEELGGQIRKQQFQ